MPRPTRPGLLARLLGALLPRRAPRSNLAQLSEREFQQRLAEALTRQGYQIVERGSMRGVDMVLRKDRQTLLLQCKHWREQKVEPEPLKELQKTIADRHAAGGLAVTTGRFSRRAERVAIAANIRLIDGEVLAGLLAGH